VYGGGGTIGEGTDRPKTPSPRICNFAAISGAISGAISVAMHAERVLR
jgi:hypothetical protein